MIDVAIIDDLLDREGSVFVDRAEDRGGPTKYGITLATLERARGHPAAAADVAALTEPEARAIYLRFYIEQPGFNRIPDAALKALLVDSGVLHGRARTVRWLQSALGVVAVDGVLGPVTLRALDELDEFKRRYIYRRVLAQRYMSVASFVAAEPKQAVFLKGWIARANEFLMEI